MNTIERTLIGTGTGLTLLGIVVLGTVELLAGKPYGAAPLTDDAGEVIAQPAVDPVLRTGLVIAGLVVLLAYGLYRMAAPARPAGDAADVGAARGD